MKHPIQPLITDKHGTIRFKKNAIVDFLAKDRLNEIAAMEFSREDREQLDMLIGYSLSGAPHLSDETYAAAELMYGNYITAEQARAKANAALLASLRDALRQPISELYGCHPDELGDGRG